MVVGREILCTTGIGEKEDLLLNRIQGGLKWQTTESRRWLEPGTQTTPDSVCFAFTVEFILLTADQLIIFIRGLHLLQLKPQKKQTNKILKV